MERPARLHVLIAAGVCIVAAGRAGAEVYLTRAEALALAFPGARVDRREFALTPADVETVQRQARVKLSSRLVSAYLGWRGDTLDGVAFFDTRTVRTMPGVFMVVVDPDTTVRRVDVLAFHEPPDYLPPRRWLATIDGRRLNDQLWPSRDVRNLSGATLTARSVTESVRQSLALFEKIVSPAVARAAGDTTTRAAEGEPR